jgi:hypothetical protein
MEVPLFFLSGASLDHRGRVGSVGAASAALDAWAVCIKKLVEVQSKY